MMLIIFVFDPLAIAMVVAANMAFAHVKGVARDPKDYEVYKEKIITKEVPVEVEKIVEKEVPIEVEKEVPVKLPKSLQKYVNEAVKHARRAGEDVPTKISRFFED